MKEPATASGRQTADAVICARQAVLFSVVLIGDGTNAASLIVYDNPASAAGTELLRMSMVGAGTYQQFEISEGIRALTGIYVDVSGAGAAYYVHYNPL